MKLNLSSFVFIVLVYFNFVLLLCNFWILNLFIIFTLEDTHLIALSTSLTSLTFCKQCACSYLHVWKSLSSVWQSEKFWVPYVGKCFPRWLGNWKHIYKYILIVKLSKCIKHCMQDNSLGAMYQLLILSVIKNCHNLLLYLHQYRSLPSFLSTFSVFLWACHINQDLYLHFHCFRVWNSMIFISFNSCHIIVWWLHFWQIVWRFTIFLNRNVFFFFKYVLLWELK